ncbi:MAG: hypothetical protein E7610_02570 [Ruminococcaceae bacterium]|nr:hypothetical protein [Oscillospiraceae bacterium]
MICSLFLLLNTAMPRALPAESIPKGVLITEIVLAVLLAVGVFLFRRRFLKIICACSTEILLYLICKLVFGPESIITKIMCWITAAVVCIITVSIVNRINWSNLRGRPDK